MQVSVTPRRLKNKRKNMIKSVVSLILIFLFVISSSAFLISIRKNNLVFDEMDIYFVCVASSKKESELETKSELLKNLGGANVIYNKSGVFYLVANVYLKLSEAEEIKTNLLSYFPESQVLKLKTKAVTRKVKKKIKSSKEETLLRYLFKLSKNFRNLHIGYLSGEIGESALISTLVKNRLELEKLCEDKTASEEFELLVLSFGNLFSLQLSNFLTGLSLAGAKQNYVCNYFVGFYVNFIEMYDCL